MIVLKKKNTPELHAQWGPVVQWLALWTLNPEIRVQVSAGPCVVERVTCYRQNMLTQYLTSKWYHPLQSTCETVV